MVRKLLIPALAGASLLVLSASLAEAQISGAVGPNSRNLGFRYDIEEAENGLHYGFRQSVQYDTNLVRTESDAETLLQYGTEDASDWISLTAADASYVRESARTTIRLVGDVGYAQYFEFDDYSGVVGGANGALDWQFTHRCGTSLRGRAERRLASFIDDPQPVENFQDDLSASADLGCFILDRVRVNGAVFAGTRLNEEDTREFADLEYLGWQTSLAFVTAKQNEIGVRYRESESTRPNNPAVEDISNQRIDAYGRMRIGNRFAVEASAGQETEQRDLQPDTDRTAAGVDLYWAPTDRVITRFGYVGGFEDVENLVGVTRETDRLRSDVDWSLGPRAAFGGFAVFIDDTLDGGATQPALTGTNEQTVAAGVYLEHALFTILNVRWQVEASQRESDIANRDFDSVSAGVTAGIKF